MVIIRQIEEMEYEGQAAEAGAWSTGLESRMQTWWVGRRKHRQGYSGRVYRNSFQECRHGGLVEGNTDKGTPVGGE